MSGEREASHVYEDFYMKENDSKVTEKKSGKRWFTPVAIFVLGALFAAVFLGIGFAVAYFAVPCAGTCRK